MLCKAFYKTKAKKKTEPNYFSGLDFYEISSIILYTPKYINVGQEDYSVEESEPDCSEVGSPISGLLQGVLKCCPG